MDSTSFNQDLKAVKIERFLRIAPRNLQKQ